MKRKITGFVFLLSILIVLVHAIAYAESGGTCGENVRWTLDDSGVLTISGSGKMMDYYPDNDIEPGFIERPWDSALVKRVVIEDGVTSIGAASFEDCGALEEISIAKSVTSVGVSAFQGCQSLREINLPDEITSVGDGVFYHCTSLETIHLPASLKTIGNNAFLNCLNLKSITIPSKVEAIGTNLFTYCLKLTSIDVDAENKNYVSDNGVLLTKDKTELICYPSSKTGSEYEIPDTVSKIRGRAFVQTEMENIVIPDSVKEIGDSSFFACDKLTGINIPASVESLRQSSINYCKQLENINVDPQNKNFSSVDGVLFNKDKTELILYPIGSARASYLIPNGVTRIHKNSFRNAVNLVNVNIPMGVTELEYNTFFGCTALKSLIIPYTVKEVSYNTADNCGSLADVYIAGPYEDIWDLVTYVRDKKVFGDAFINFFTPYILNTSTVTKIGEEYIFNIDCHGALPYSRLITVLYKDGVMTGMEITEFTDGSPEWIEGGNITVKAAAPDADTAKAFIWSSVNGMRPISYDFVKSLNG